MTGKVSFVLGAGFSAPFNIPTMKPFLSSFYDFSSRRYSLLTDTLESHMKKLTDDSDIEELLSNLSKAEELSSAMPSQSHMSSELDRWSTESRSLKAHLISYIIERCEQFDRDQANECIGPFFNELNSHIALEEINFFTTNYDRILEFVSDANSIPMSDGFVVDEDDLVAPWCGDFSAKFRLYKLHGSVTYYVDRQRDTDKKFLRLDRGYPPLPGPDFRLSRQGRALEPLMVLPTLEKEAMDDPYGHLMHKFTETLSKGGLVVALGTSLRDAHLVSAMTYSKDEIVMLVVDIEPDYAIARIPEIDCVSLKANVSECLIELFQPIVNLAGECAKLSSKADILSEVNAFADKYNNFADVRKSISNEDKDALVLLRNTTDDGVKLKVIRSLFGHSDPLVVNSVIGFLLSDESAAVRKGAAGFLGVGKISTAVSALAEAAKVDSSSDVRLETYLALINIGGNEAHSALVLAKENWPNDSFFWARDNGQE